MGERILFDHIKLIDSLLERINKIEAKQKFLETNWDKINRLDVQHNEMMEKIEKLENFIPDVLSTFEKRLNDLGKTQDLHEERFTELAPRCEQNKTVWQHWVEEQLQDHAQMLQPLEIFQSPLLLEDKPIKTCCLHFGQALMNLKDGNRIGRWNTNKIYVYLNEQGDLRVNTISGKDCPWLPNQEELLCDDWRVIADV